MTKNDKNKSLHIEMKTSLGKSLFISLPHLIVFITVLICVFYNGINVIYFLISLIFIFFSFIYYLKLHIKMDKQHSILNLKKDTKHNWYLNSKREKNLPVEISGKSFVCDYFMILNFFDKTDNHYSAMITRDSVETENYRKLKVFVKTQKFDE